ncbi:MAG: biopolymer transporter ExbD [Verrucomicrobiota bacterium]|jgi:biopolymer transport protein ExbD
MKRSEHPKVELQIAPLIDVCFLLLFFYILTSKPVVPEKDLSVSLPGTAQQDVPLIIPDEQRIEILESGQIILNQEPLDTVASRDLPKLHVILRRLVLSAAANKTVALITIDADDRAKHQRLVDVLNACSKAGVGSVTFADSLEAQN